MIVAIPRGSFVWRLDEESVERRAEAVEAAMAHETPPEPVTISGPVLDDLSEEAERLRRENAVGAIVAELDAAGINNAKPKGSCAPPWTRAVAAKAYETRRTDAAPSVEAQVAALQLELEAAKKRIRMLEDKNARRRA